MRVPSLPVSWLVLFAAFSPSLIAEQADQALRGYWTGSAGLVAAGPVGIGPLMGVGPALSLKGELPVTLWLGLGEVPSRLDFWAGLRLGGAAPVPLSGGWPRPFPLVSGSLVFRLDADWRFGLEAPLLPGFTLGWRDHELLVQCLPILAPSGGGVFWGLAYGYRL